MPWSPRRLTPGYLYSGRRARAECSSPPTTRYRLASRGSHGLLSATSAPGCFASSTRGGRPRRDAAGTPHVAQIGVVESQVSRASPQAGGSGRGFPSGPERRSDRSAVPSSAFRRQRRPPLAQAGRQRGSQQDRRRRRRCRVVGGRRPHTVVATSCAHLRRAIREEGHSEVAGRGSVGVFKFRTLPPCGFLAEGDLEDRGRADGGCPQGRRRVRCGRVADGHEPAHRQASRCFGGPPCPHVVGSAAR